MVLRVPPHAPRKKGDKKEIGCTGEQKSRAKAYGLDQGPQSDGTGHQTKIYEAVIAAHGQASEFRRRGFSDKRTNRGESDGQAYTQAESGQEKVDEGYGRREPGNGEGCQHHTQESLVLASPYAVADGAERDPRQCIGY